jgi:hypothetical protein
MESLSGGCTGSTELLREEAQAVAATRTVRVSKARAARIEDRSRVVAIVVAPYAPAVLAWTPGFSLGKSLWMKGL